MGAVHAYIGLPAYVLHHWAAYLEGQGAIDLLLDNGGASSRAGLPSIWDEATSSTCRETSTDLHKISLQGKWEKDRGAEHGVHI